MTATSRAVYPDFNKFISQRLLRCYLTREGSCVYQEASGSFFAVPAPSAWDARLIPPGAGSLGEHVEFMRRHLNCAAVVVTIAQPFASLLDGGTRGEATAARSHVCAIAANASAVGSGEKALPDPDRLADPIAAGDLGFGFYARIPLRLSSGCNLGTLAAVDVLPRNFAKNELARLKMLADILVEIIEFRLSTSEPAASSAAKA